MDCPRRLLKNQLRIKNAEEVEVALEIGRIMRDEFSGVKFFLRCICLMAKIHSLKVVADGWERPFPSTCDTNHQCLSPTLVRAIGRWSLAALTINCIIGSGVFGLPSVIAGTLGNASPFAWLFAAVATGLVMACFAEVASRFDQSGGVFLYTRTAFGRTSGIAVAWLGFLARLTAIAANANLFVVYLAEFWSRAS